MKQIHKNLISLFGMVLTSQVLTPGMVRATEGFEDPSQDPYEPGALPVQESGGGPIGISTNNSLIDFVTTLLNLFLSLLGVLLVIILLWGAVQYMTAGGSDDRVKKATNTIQNAVIGMLLLSLTYVFANFLLSIVAG